MTDDPDDPVTTLARRLLPILDTGRPETRAAGPGVAAMLDRPGTPEQDAARHAAAYAVMGLLDAADRLRDAAAALLDGTGTEADLLAALADQRAAHDTLTAAAVHLDGWTTPEVDG